MKELQWSDTDEPVVFVLMPVTKAMGVTEFGGAENEAGIDT